MKKGSFRIIGLVTSLIGIICIKASLGITGAVISSIPANMPLYIFPLTLVIAGILMAASGDALQAWLEEKEKRHKSPSLEHAVQTKDEEREFKHRYSGKPGIVQRLFGKKVEEVQQDRRYYGGENYQNKLSDEQQNLIEKTKAEKEEQEKIKRMPYGAQRNELAAAKMRIEEGVADINNFIAVRIGDFKHIVDRKMIPGPNRPTIHFSVNQVYSPNGENGEEGAVNWRPGKNYNSITLIPLKDLIGSNRDNFFGGSEVDVYTVGLTNLPKSARIIHKRKGESFSDFRKRAEKTIEEMGFQILRGHGEGWRGTHDVGSPALNNLSHGFYRLLTNSGYRTGPASSHPIESAGYGGNKHGYMDIRSLRELYTNLKIKNKAIMPYKQWLKEQILKNLIPDKDYILHEERKNDFVPYRDTYFQTFKKIMDDDKKIYRKWIKENQDRLVELNKENGEEYQDKIKKIKLQNKQYERHLERLESGQYNSAIQEWSSYWNKKATSIGEEESKRRYGEELSRLRKTAGKYNQDKNLRYRKKKAA